MKQTTNLESALPLFVETNLENICEIYNRRINLIKPTTGYVMHQQV